MKYLNNYIIALLALLSFSLASCTKEDSSIEPIADLAEGTEFEVSLGLRSQDVCHSSIRGQMPLIENLWILVFDENHRFICRRKAVLEGVTNQSSEPFFPLPGESTPPAPSVDNEIQKFTATLVSTSKPCYIHFVANYDWPADYPQDYFLKGKGEGEIIAALKTDKEVFWRKVELSKLQPTTFNNKVVRLLRNQARVVVSLTGPLAIPGSDFDLLGYALYNVPDKGTVAPFVYDLSAPAGSLPYSFPTKPEDPTEPAGVNLIIPTEADVVMPADLKDGRRMFEYDNHAHPDKAFVIIKGQKKGKPVGFYKVDLKRDLITGDIYDVIRNTSYRILISSVITEGYATLQEAAENPAGNNLLASIELSEFLSITDGENTLDVDKLGGVFVNPGTFETIVTYTGTDGTPGDNPLNHISFRLLDPNNNLITPTGDAYLGIPSLNTSTGILSVQVKQIPDEADGDMLYNLLVIATAPIGGAVLLRKLPVLLTQPYGFNARIIKENNPSNPSTGDDVQIKFDIPTSMPKAAFPFEVLLEVTNLTPSLAPGHNNEMTIVLKDKKFYYSYIVKSDSEIGKTQTLYFKRNKKNAPCSATLMSEYHDDATVSL